MAEAIRSGTDGCRLSLMGLPCPEPVHPAATAATAAMNHLRAVAQDLAEILIPHHRDGGKSNVKK